MLVGLPDDAARDLLLSGLDVEHLGWGRGAGMASEHRSLALSTVPTPEGLPYYLRKNDAIATASDASAAASEEDPQAPPFAEATRVRIALAAQLAELSDLDASFVPIYRDASRADGSAPLAAGLSPRLLGSCPRHGGVMEQAVVTARLRDVTWAEVGQALEVTPQTTHERFGDDVSRFHDELLSPETRITAGSSGRSGIAWRRRRSTPPRPRPS